MGFSAKFLGTVLWAAALAGCAQRPAAPVAEIQKPLDPVMIRAGDDIQKHVDAHPPGTEFVLAAGLHRLQTVVPTPGSVFRGEVDTDGRRLTVLTGATVLAADRFTQNPLTGHWEMDATEFLRNLPYIPSRCAPYRDAGFDSRSGTHGFDHPNKTSASRYDGCDYPQDLYLDGKFLWRVSNADHLRPGAWHWDTASGVLTLPQDPTTGVLELSLLPHAFAPPHRKPAGDVTVRDLIIEKYAAPSQRGAVQPNGGKGWKILDNEIRFNHGYGIRTADHILVDGNYVHHNGQLGIGGVGKGPVRILNNEITHNQVRGYRTFWEGGGTKFTNTDGLVIRGNNVQHNYGPGLWTDIDNINSVIENNKVSWNSLQGIVHEIGFKALIRKNVVEFNGAQKDVWMWGAQILVQNSSDVEVTGNQVTVHPDFGDGIGIINQRRGLGPRGSRVSANNRVHGNTVTYLGAAGTSGISDDTSPSPSCTVVWNNQFDGNTYNVLDETRAHWDWCGVKNWPQLKATGQEIRGRLGRISGAADMM